MSGPDVVPRTASYPTSVPASGVIPAFDWWLSVISQYANSPILTGILGRFFAATDLSALFDGFFANVFDFENAVGEGLDVWGRRVGVVRTINVPAVSTYVGFQEQGTPFADTFNDLGSFYTGAPITNNYNLTDDAFRVLIRAKMLTLLSDSSSSSINKILLTLFPGRGNCYVVDNLNKTMVYHFEFVLTLVEQAIVAQSGVLPRPSGVAASVFHL